ncbi:sensor histidine kinase [Geoalkalibacter halelectricus]|uniref:histidine kinase n=1 Tax=Geoalkalibacter halelectricus TaxID=2847045 RepID=A0ABY5ZLY8_9BACT|nr:ATP-binding protein [Geoalkalibacter halelectricus]MDO3378506.1 ATP-binding protein [Geoalkalibacter halelectricus]UWZ80177.1 ATP-binding protein [Geoalkalibacter halelectricus]
MGDDLYFFLLYLFYGLAFYSMGVAVVSVKTRSSRLKVAPLLWLFALFAFLHAGNEWLELFVILEATELSKPALVFFTGLKLTVKLVSYLFLMAFGLSLLASIYPRRRSALIATPLVLLAGALVSLGLHDVGSLAEFFHYSDLRGRNLIGFPAAVAAGVGLFAFARSTASTSARAARGFRGAGLALIAYAVLTGLIPSGTVLFPPAIPVELLRGISAFVILHFLMSALHVFDLEQNTLLEERLNRLAQTEKLNAIGRLAAGIVHEINNPLSNIALNVEMLKGEVLNNDASPKLHKRFTFIERNIERASHIARELLSFSREKEDQFEQVDINELIDSSLTLIGSRRLEFDFRIKKAVLPAVWGVPWKIEEVFLNLYINAMDASTPGAAIVIESLVVHNEVVVKIADQGEGISAENLGRVMVPFFTTKEVGRGTGLGLSICYGIMELHGGRMELSSTAAGTEVRLYFPLHRQGDEGGKNFGSG